MAALQSQEHPYPCESEDDGDEPLKDAPHLYRLFVGWVPKFYAETQLQPLFEQCGKVKDIIILKDKVTGQPRGCAFVSYGTKEEAEQAIARLDRQVHLPGAALPLEVRFARFHHYIQAGIGGGDNRQLFFSNASTALSEEHLAAFFAQFGIVEEVNLFRERRTGQSKGCGFVMMQTREMAVRAIEALGGAEGVTSSSGIVVKWADPELQLKKKKAVEDSNADNRMVFFAKVLRSATEDDVKALFSRLGKVYDVNLFRAFQGAPTTKGCGLVTMGTHEDAVACIEALDSKFVWEGMESPMVVKWMDAALQRRRREQHLAAMRQGLVPSMSMVGTDNTWPLFQPVGLPASIGALVPTTARISLIAGATPTTTLVAHPSSVPSAPAGPAPSAAPLGGAVNGSGVPELPELSESPPNGCAPDAIKLFVGNVPKSCTEDQLLPFFETIGRVVELVIVRDKASHESKGSAFVWYANRQAAERAILQFNLRHILPDPCGEQDRPLVVRKAKVRSGKPLGNGGTMHQSQQLHPTVSMLSGGLEPRLDASAYPVHLQPPQEAMAFGLNQYHLPQKVGPNSHGSAMDGRGMTQGVVLLGGLASVPQFTLGAPFRGAHFISLQGAPAVADTGGLFEAYAHSGADGMDSFQQMQVLPGGGQPAPGAGHSLVDSLVGGGGGGNGAPMQSSSQMAVSLQLNPHQLAATNNHLYSVQAMSGAQLHVSPGAPGLFNLVISGGRPQVEAAKGLVGTLIGS